MSKSDILQELPNLALEDRREIFDRLCELEENEMLNGGGLTAEEKAMLDQELEDYRRTPAAGSPWHEVEARTRKSQREMARAHPSSEDTCCSALAQFGKAKDQQAR